MTPNTKSILDEIIRNQEGGWVLTENANDPDGGWTYGGMTKKTFCSVSRGWDGYTYEMIADVVKQGDASKNGLGEVKSGFMKGSVMQAYEQIFIIPSRMEELPIGIQFAYLSCAINRGVENAVRALQMACNAIHDKEVLDVDGKIGPATIREAVDADMMDLHVELLREFCHDWRMQYAELVVQNSQAWYTVAQGKMDILNKPKVFRAPDLIGWLNRVHYCEAR